MGTSRRHYTDEFKRESVGLLASSGRPLSQIARELGIAASMLRSWRNKGDGGHADLAAENGFMSGLLANVGRVGMDASSASAGNPRPHSVIRVG
jgi:transposase-like protein